MYEAKLNGSNGYLYITHRLSIVCNTVQQALILASIKFNEMVLFDGIYDLNSATRMLSVIVTQLCTTCIMKIII
jgi:hypothetical protein